jgi:inorganic pyrophosphatase
MPRPNVPDAVDVLVELPRLSFVKRRADGALDYLSPLPSPFNYGSVPGTISGDGDPLDAVLFGPRRRRGAVVRASVLGWVDFVDGGAEDPKLVCGTAPPRAVDRLLVVAFFRVYERGKRLLNRMRGRRGETRVRAIELGPRRRDVSR